jgi:hypothetical protein
MKYQYKEETFDIKVCEGDWGKHEGWFHVENDQPYNFGYSFSFDEMKKTIRKKYDEYHSVVPKDEEGWLKLFESCIIVDGYEDWHVDKKLALRLLKSYKETQ